MIYVQLRARVKLAQGETLHVADAANVLGSEKAGHCSLFCPTSPGVYTLDAIAVAKALKKVFHRRTFPSSVRMSATSTASRRAAKIFCDPCGRRRRC